MLNELRRDLYAQIEPQQKLGTLPEVAKRNSTNPQWIVRTDNMANLAMINLDEVDEVIVLLNEDTKLNDLKVFPKNKLRLALPTICRHVNHWKTIIDKMIVAGYKKWEIANYWGVSALPKNGIDLSFDAPIYMFNSQATQMAKEIGATRICLPVEDTLNNLQIIAKNSALPVVWEVYGDIPLFTSAACIRNNDCKNCERGEKWIKLVKNGHKYDVYSKNCQTMLFDANHYCVTTEAQMVKADFYRASFVYKKYSAKQVAEIFAKLQIFADVSNCHKGNLNGRIL